jgi:hypothetical protein
VVVPSLAVGARFTDLLTSSYAAATSATGESGARGNANSGSCDSSSGGSGGSGGSGEGRGVIVSVVVVAGSANEAEKPTSSCGDNDASLPKELQDDLQDWDITSDLVIVAPACSAYLDLMFKMTNDRTMPAAGEDGESSIAQNGTRIAVAKPTAAALTKALCDAGIVGGRNCSSKLAKGNYWVWD